MAAKVFWTVLKSIKYGVEAQASLLWERMGRIWRRISGKWQGPF